MRQLCNSNKSTIEEQQKLYGGKMWSQVFLTQPYMTSEGLHRLDKDNVILKRYLRNRDCMHNILMYIELILWIQTVKAPMVPWI